MGLLRALGVRVAGQGHMSTDFRWIVGFKDGTQEVIVPSDRPLTGIHLFALERARQTLKGYGTRHDAQHLNGELVRAAGAYARHARYQDIADATPMWPWPWRSAGFQPGTPIQDLVKAGALLAAEVDRRLAAGER